MMMLRKFITNLLILTSLIVVAENPKREFRGAWLHVIGQSQWMSKNVQQQQKYIEEQNVRNKDIKSSL